MSNQRPLSARAQRLLERIKVALEARGVATPTADELARELHVPPEAIREMLRVGVAGGQIQCLEGSIYYSSEQLAALGVRFESVKEFSVRGVSEEFDTTRRYAVALLKHFHPEFDEES